MKHAAIEGFREIRQRKQAIKIYESSITEKNDYVFFLIRENLELKLVILSPESKRNLPSSFVAEEDGRFEYKAETFKYLVCSCNHQNAIALRKAFPFTRPKPIGSTPAIGTGDRIGLATPGHIRALKGFNICPVLAQQSVREMDRTLRTPREVLDDVSWAVFQEGYRGGFAADADHLKTLSDADAAFEAGFTMYTIDPSDFVDNEADNYNLKELREEFEKLPWKELKSKKDDFLRTYLSKEFNNAFLKESKKPEFPEEKLLRAAVKYSAAIAHTARIRCHLKELCGERRFDVEMSVDETETPTSALEHVFIVSELKRLGVRIDGLALRFVGRFEKAVDYIGNLRQFEGSLMRHASIAKIYGSYKLSIHSGSDKFSIYPTVCRLASDMVHLKTSGTSYLEALRVVVKHDPNLFRGIVKYSLKCFEKDRKSYSLSTDLPMISDPDEVPAERLETVFLDRDSGRQLLHVTYGSILTAKRSNGEWLFREKIRRVLIENEEEHYETVARYIRRHIESVWFITEKK